MRKPPPKNTTPGGDFSFAKDGAANNPKKVIIFHPTPASVDAQRGENFR